MYGSSIRTTLRKLKRCKSELTVNKPSTCDCLVKENIVGYYSSSSKLNAIDLEIDQMFRKYSDNPVLIVFFLSNRCSLLWISTMKLEMFQQKDTSLKKWLIRYSL